MLTATPSLLCALALLAGGASNDDDKHKAPPPLQVDGLIGTPIDIQELRGTFVFDATTRTARARAEMVFEMTADGLPLFDLRQDIDRLVLNGEEIETGLAAAHEVGPNTGTMRILEQELAAGASHNLVFEYELERPQAPRAADIGWSEGSLSWDTWFSDLNPGRYLEMWMPANLLYDRFSLELELELVGLEADHELITNAAIEERGRYHWMLRFPATTTAFSPMIVVVPSVEVERSQSRTKIDGRRFVIDVTRRKDARGDLSRIHDQVARDLKEFSASTGPWPHGDTVPVYIWRGGRSMEYDGATTSSTGALRHELFHSWWGRGVKPASQNDGWFDEAWDSYRADGDGPRSVKGEGRPVELCSSDPYNRITPMQSYREGAAFFGRLAHLIGIKKLDRLMAEFYEQHVHDPVFTHQLEQHLAAGSGKEEAVRQLFHRYVYGKDGKREG